MSCTCTSGEQALFALWREVDRHGAALAMKAEGEDLRPEDDPFLTEELVLSSVISDQYERLCADAKAQVIAELDKLNKSQIGLVEVQEAINSVEETMGQVVDDDDDEVGDVLGDAVRNGSLDAASEADVPDRVGARDDVPEHDSTTEQTAAQALLAAALGLRGISLTDGGDDSEDQEEEDADEEEEPDEDEDSKKATTAATLGVGTVLAGSAAAAAVWLALRVGVADGVNGAWTSQVVPAVMAALTALATPQANHTEVDAQTGETTVVGSSHVAPAGAATGSTSVALSDVRAALDAIVNGPGISNYLRLVASAATSRAYHYGLLKSAALSHRQSYQLVAVLDARTSELCRFLNGKVFPIGSAVQAMEDVASSDDPDAVKTSMPWQRYKDVKNMTVDQLRDAGCYVPPFHGHCRTTAVIV